MSDTSDSRARKSLRIAPELAQSTAALIAHIDAQAALITRINAQAARIAALEAGLQAIIDRSYNDRLGSAKVIGMRDTARALLADGGDNE